MKRRRALLFSLPLVLALCAAGGLWLHRERQQDVLNRQLIDALVRNDTKMALILVNKGADPNTRFDPPAKPSLKLLVDQLLHHSPPSNDSPTAFLIACGIDWNPQGEGMYGKPGIADENLPLLHAMFAHQADVQVKTWFDATALLAAVERQRLHTVELLLQHGANVNAQRMDWEGRISQTPLLLAAPNDPMNLTALLLSYGANPNLQNADGVAALHACLGSPMVQITLPELLAHGADPNLRSKGGTPLQYAQKNGYHEAVRLLQQHGVK